jgi:hypothetical protein
LYSVAKADYEKDQLILENEIKEREASLISIDKNTQERIDLRDQKLFFFSSLIDSISIMGLTTERYERVREYFKETVYWDYHATILGINTNIKDDDEWNYEDETQNIQIVWIKDRNGKDYCARAGNGIVFLKRFIDEFESGTENELSVFNLCSFLDKTNKNYKKEYFDLFKDVLQCAYQNMDLIGHPKIISTFDKDNTWSDAMKRLLQKKLTEMNNEGKRLYQQQQEIIGQIKQLKFNLIASKTCLNNLEDKHNVSVNLFNEFKAIANEKLNVRKNEQIEAYKVTDGDILWMTFLNRHKYLEDAAKQHFPHLDTSTAFETKESLRPVLETMKKNLMEDLAKNKFYNATHYKMKDSAEQTLDFLLNLNHFFLEKFLESFSLTTTF